jgi:hypothetical protein
MAVRGREKEKGNKVCGCGCVGKERDIVCVFVCERVTEKECVL